MFQSELKAPAQGQCAGRWQDRAALRTCAVAQAAFAANRRALRVLQRPQGHARLLKGIYAAANEEATLDALGAFADSDLGRRYPGAVAAWERAWEPRQQPDVDLVPLARRQPGVVRNMIYFF